MAIASRQRRAAAMDMGGVPGVCLPEADNSVDADDKLHLLGLYALLTLSIARGSHGILAGFRDTRHVVKRNDRRTMV